MSRLFEPVDFRGVRFRNRVFVSPMCMYSSNDGMPTDWHLVHLGSRAVGGAGAVIVEATAVSPEGRITPWDSGIWSDAHAEAFGRVTAFIKEAGAVAGVQLAHAGRKASTDAPWRGGKALAKEAGGWDVIGPSAVAFGENSPVPEEMTTGDVERVTRDFADAARRARTAGFDVVEIHAAHGYLLHEFLSPLSNHRHDQYGGSFENRTRLVRQVVEAVRGVWPKELPLFVRISATDWAEGGWDLPQSVELAKVLKTMGVDLIDCSSGALVPHARMTVGPGYQVPFAEAIRREAAIATGAVGMITEPAQAEEIVASGKADVVLLAREMLRDPYWPMRAARALGTSIQPPQQYGRAWA